MFSVFLIVFRLSLELVVTSLTVAPASVVARIISLASPGIRVTSVDCVAD